MRNNPLLNADISPDGVISGGGSTQPDLTPKIDDKVEVAEVAEVTEDPPKVDEPLVSIEDFDKTVIPEPDKTPKVELKPEPKVEEKVEDKPAVKATDKTAGRDYSDIADEHVPAFKKMSNEAFAAMKPIYLERQQAVAKIKELEESNTKLKVNALPENYLENENGYVLDPEYRQAASNLQLANFAVRHWKDQLRNIEEGKDWIDVDIDEKGNPVYSKPKASDSEARVNVLEYFQHAVSQANRINEKVAGVKSTFLSRNKAQATELAVQEKQWFPAFQDEKHALQPVVAKVMSQFPAAFRSNPLARPLAKALVVLSVMSKASNEAKTPEVKKPDIKKAVGPTTADISGGGSKGNVNGDVTVDDFNKYIN